ncbi:MAG TPA: C4-type zinc ribbon domain-containing protein [Thermodesulfobacteriota bacterium]|nr:C4-type zinc ribbon domain-containing protein [Thermodesulfobacteriota bacterium]HNU72118.1 C4-type zinc ribbon domain-containing protein [Thermodesulfobacteriota bacterium]HOC38896.1 C4-type zinc ribbon domain-containing protein [Thermodesulfobacteriota bacterium]
MEEQLELLKQLQGIDTVLSKIETRRQDIPRMLQRIEKERTKREQLYEKEQLSLKKVDEDKRKNEQKLKEQNERLRKSQDKLTAVKTNREYHAVLKEIEDINHAASELETEILKCMEEADRIGQLLKTEEDGYRDWIGQSEKQQRELQGEVLHCDEDAALLQEQRLRVVEKIDSDLLARYERLRERRQGLAVVAVVGGLCQGCNINIPPQQTIELQKDPGTIMNCPFCNRIIYSSQEHAS